MDGSLAKHVEDYGPMHESVLRNVLQHALEGLSTLHNAAGEKVLHRDMLRLRMV